MSLPPILTSPAKVVNVFDVNVILVLPSLALMSLPLIRISPSTTTSVEKVEIPVTLIPPEPTINPPAPKVRFELSSRAPEVPARTTLPAVKSETVADDSVVSPPEISAPPLASIAPVNVDIPLTKVLPVNSACCVVSLLVPGL